MPNLGKYHMTACTRCFKIIDPEVAKENKMKCDCGGRIKKGVDFRISEIADYDEPKHPDFRPKYVHLMPLAELIATLLNKGVTTKTVQNRWQKLIDAFGSEIDVLINVSLDEIKKLTLMLQILLNRLETIQLMLFQVVGVNTVKFSLIIKLKRIKQKN